MDSPVVVLIHQPVLPPPVDVVHDTRTAVAECLEANYENLPFGAHMRYREWCLLCVTSSSGGTNPSLTGILGSQTANLVVN